MLKVSKSKCQFGFIRKENGVQYLVTHHFEVTAPIRKYVFTRFLTKDIGGGGGSRYELLPTVS